MSQAEPFRSIATPSALPKMGAPSGPRWRGGGSASLLAHGEPMVWLTGGMLAICLAMIVGLIAAIVFFGLRTFWPSPIERVVAFDGATLLGEVDEETWFKPTPQFLDSLDSVSQERARRAMEDRELLRQRIRTGNYAQTGSHYTWINKFQVQERDLPEWAIVVEQWEGGRYYGILRGFRTLPVETTDAQEEQFAASAPSAENPVEAWRLYRQYHPEVLGLRRQRETLEVEVGTPVHQMLSSAELDLKKAEVRSGLDSPEWKAAAEELGRVRAKADEKIAALRIQVDQITEKAQRYQLVLKTASSPDETVIPLVNIVRAYPANRLSTSEKWSVYASRWGEFLSAGPREGNAEGGVFPALVGTFVMTILMSIAVVPLGVIAALFLREYAKAGFLVSITRIAINNLAGVPSIVFGVFGLGFFVYVCGTSIDELFFPVRATSAGVFGQGGVMWASLTLALLTLPVVIVATEESLSAVPNSMREGSYACGASKWQTIRRIVLPRAMPGVLTGLILAVARGAGEVAPLMLVGVASYAPELPVDGDFPYVHPERQFMHLAYSIYWTSSQSPNSEAAKPLVFTMTLLLIALIAILNLLATWLRSRLRRRFATSAF